MAQSIEELGLPEQAKLARAASTARPSELFAEQARELIVLTPQAVKVLADAQAGEREPDVALFKEFFDRTRSLLLEVCSP